MINKQDFIAQVDSVATAVQGMPVSAGALRFLADELRKGDPPWWQKTLKAWEKRPAIADAWNLFLGSVHFEALSDANNPLGRYLPSCGGTAEADPAPALRDFLKEPPASFYEHLKEWEVRWYDQFIASFWTGPAQLFFEERDLDYYLVEVNAGGGLNLVGDAGVANFDHGLVAARIGLDPRPLLMEDIVDRRWLTACVLPDDAAAIGRLDEAIETVREGCRREPNFLQLVKCAVDKAPKFMAKNIPSNDDGVGLLAMNVRTTSSMNPEQNQGYLRDMLEMMRPWKDRALWAECEYTPMGMLVWRFHRVVDGLLRTIEVGRVDSVTKKYHYDLGRAKSFFALDGAESDSRGKKK